MKNNNTPSSIFNLIPLFAIFAIISALAYAGRAVVAREGSSHLSISHLLVLQSLISMPILYFMAKFKGISLRPNLKNNRANYAFRILAGIATTFFLMNALKVMPATLASTLSCTTPLFTALLAPVLLKERSTIAIFAVTLIGFLGLSVAASPYLDSLSINTITIGLLCGLSGAFLQIYLRRVASTGEPGLRGVFWMHVISLLMGTIGCLANREFSFTTQEASVCFFTAILFVIAQLSNSAAYAKGRALAVNALSFLTLPLTMVLSYIFLKESISFTVLIGMLITMPSCFCLVWLEQRHLHQIHNEKKSLSVEDILEEHAQEQHSLGAMAEPLFETMVEEVELSPRKEHQIPFLDRNLSLAKK